MRKWNTRILVKFFAWSNQIPRFSQDVRAFFVQRTTLSLLCSSQPRSEAAATFAYFANQIFQYKTHDAAVLKHRWCVGVYKEGVTFVAGEGASCVLGCARPLTL